MGLPIRNEASSSEEKVKASESTVETKVKKKNWFQRFFKSLY